MNMQRMPNMPQGMSQGMMNINMLYNMGQGMPQGMMKSGNGMQMMNGVRNAHSNPQMMQQQQQGMVGMQNASAPNKLANTQSSQMNDDWINKKKSFSQDHFDSLKNTQEKCQ